MINRDKLKETLLNKINKEFINIDINKTEIDLINSFYITVWINNKPEIFALSESDWYLNNKSIEEITDRLIYSTDLKYRNMNDENEENKIKR